ncbi:BQ2448_7300 [Microbotryum intermedium]|uniref:BQ2448_7300 protein n=1 Tax=Microbotryum intermedium TaxID=269621 RepID=A0A238FNA9_9BASI|nr:BQ2448_7300 [Microbotryum intermedium]
MPISSLQSRSYLAATPQELKNYFMTCTTSTSTNTWTCSPLFFSTVTSLYRGRGTRTYALSTLEGHMLQLLTIWKCTDLNRLDQLFYSEAAHGFKTRLIVLNVCFSLILALTVTQLALVEIERRRNKQPYWLWRWIRIEGEPFLVTHQILITAYSAIAAAIVNIFYVVFEWRMVLNHDSQKTRIARRSTIYFPMVLGGLLCSFSLLQAFVVVLSRKGRTWSKWTLRSCVVAYFLCIILFTAGVVIIAIIGSKSWTHIWSLYQGLREDMIELVPTWVPGTAPPISPALYAEFRQLRATAASSFRQQFAVKWLYTAMALLNFVVSTQPFTRSAGLSFKVVSELNSCILYKIDLQLASLCMALWAMMRRQLSRHSETIGRVTSDGEIFISSVHVETLQLDDAQDEVALTSHTVSRISFAQASSPLSEDDHDCVGKEEAVSDPQLLPRNAFQAPAPQPWQGARELRQAKDWVLMMGGVVMITSALLAAVLTWSSTLILLPFAVIPTNDRFPATTEMVNFLFVWVWAIVTLPFAATNAYHAWRKLSHTNATGAIDGSESNVAMEAGIIDKTWRSADTTRGRGCFTSAEESLDAFLRSLEPQPNRFRREMSPSLQGEVPRSEPTESLFIYESNRSK